MKELTKRYFLFVLLVMGLGSTSYAQLPDFDLLVKGGGEDMTTYMGYYVNPFMNSFGTGIVNGWYNTAKPHQALGFDLTIYGSLVKVPDAERLFTFNQSEYNSLQLASGASSAQLPTLLGPSTSEQLVSDYTDPDTGINIRSNPFDAPSGLQDDLKTSNSVPVPMIQLAVGIVKNTELIVRYAPSVNIGNAFKLRFFGLGVKHDVKQWIPGIKTLPIDLSILIGYTNLDTDYSFSDTSVIQTQNAKADFDIKAWTIQALISKKLSVVTFYGGVGYNIINSDFIMSGDYLITDATDPALAVTVTDPVNLSFKTNGFRATVGLRLKLAVFTFHGDYTVQKYNTISFGFGINVR